MKQTRGLVLALIAATSVAYGADPIKQSGPTSGSQVTEAPSITTTLPTAPVSKVTGFLDVRPTYDMSSATNDARLETSIGLGYKFTNDVSITAEQPFWSNITSTGPGGASTGSTMLREGHVRLDVKNLATSGKNISFGYQLRAYYPSREAWRDNGFITQIRNAFYITAQISPAFSITFFEVPIVHVFNRANGPGGVNPSFENRLIVAPELSLMGGKLTIGCPIFFHQIKNREGNLALAEQQAAEEANAGVGRSVATLLSQQKAVSGFGGRPDEWWYSVWIGPEIMYNVSKEIQLGVSYDSGELVAADLSKLTVLDGLKNGAPKLAFRMSL